MAGVTEVAIALGPVVACAGISYWQGHDLHKDLLWASLRTLLQLILLGYILTWVFKNASPVLSVSMALVMTMNAAIHARARIKSRYPGIFIDNLLATAVTIWPLALLGPWLLHAHPWWSVDLFLPLLGMLLGSSMNGISLGVEHFSHDVREKKEEVLSWIALGATTNEATLPLFQRCLKMALTPTLNSMFSVGIVSIPGMMTGQLLAGNTPTQAVITQIIMMLLIASGAYLGTLMGLVLARNKLFNQLGQPCF